MDQGLQSNHFNQGAAYTTDNGIMYFGGNQGFNQFHPESMYLDEYYPPCTINRFSNYLTAQLPLQTMPPLKVAIHSAKQLKLSYKQSFFCL